MAVPSTFARPLAAPAARPEPAFALHHRGFAVAVQREGGRFGQDSFGFAIADRGLLLHRSGGEFRSAQAADRAGRRFVDDALAAFDGALALQADGWDD